jgi:tight adherence protein B
VRNAIRVGLAFLIGLLLLGPASAAVAQDEDDAGAPGEAPTLIRAVDSRDPDAPATLELMTAADASGIKMTQDGEEVTIDGVAALADSRALNIVFVVDTGAVMEESGGLQAAREAIAASVGTLGDNDGVGIVEAGDGARELIGITRSKERVVQATEDLGASDGGAAIYNGIEIASDMLIAEPGPQPNVIVLTSGQDTNDGNLTGSAMARLDTAGAELFVQGYGEEFDPASFASTNSGLDGEQRAVITGSELTDDFIDDVGTILGWLTANQYTVTFSPAITEPSTVAPTEATLGDQTIEFAYVVGAFDQGALALQPYEPESGGAFSSLPFLEGDMGMLIIVGLVLVAVAGFVYAIGLIFGPDDRALSNVLQPYSEGYQATDDDDDSSALARTALLQRAVSITEQVADRQGYLSRTEAALERADLPLRAAEALFFYVALVALVAIVGLLLLPLMVVVILVLMAAMIPPAAVSFLAGQRRRKFQSQLPDTLQLLSGTLRAGYSLMQGVEAVSQEVAEPMGKELRRVVTEARLGRPLEESMEGVAERMSSPDFAWAVMAIRIQREVGGNLSELLLTVAETMIARERLRRDINSLTAEGRMSAIILGLLPVGLAVVMFVINPEYMNKLIDTTLGNVLLGIAIFAMLVGFAWMRQIIKIEV